jgi:hypothetical protein
MTEGNFVMRKKTSSGKSTMPMTGEHRYQYFIETVCQNDSVWALKDRGDWMLLGDHKREVIFPVWPTKEDAKRYSGSIRYDSTPARISLESFLSEFKLLFTEQHYSCMVFPTVDAKGSVVSVDIIGADIEKCKESSLM